LCYASFFAGYRVREEVWKVSRGTQRSNHYQFENMAPRAPDVRGSQTGDRRQETIAHNEIETEDDASEDDADSLVGRTRSTADEEPARASEDGAKTVDSDADTKFEIAAAHC
jgi:hypothetical protein